MSFSGSYFPLFAAILYAEPRHIRIFAAIGARAVGLNVYFGRINDGI